MLSLQLLTPWAVRRPRGDAHSPTPPLPGPRIPSHAAYLFAPTPNCASSTTPIPHPPSPPPPRVAPRSPHPGHPPSAGPRPLRPPSVPAPGPSPIAPPTTLPFRSALAPRHHRPYRPDPRLLLLAAAVDSVAAPPPTPAVPISCSGPPSPSPCAINSGALLERQLDVLAAHLAGPRNRAAPPRTELPRVYGWLVTPAGRWRV